MASAGQRSLIPTGSPYCIFPCKVGAMTKIRYYRPRDHAFQRFVPEALQPIIGKRAIQEPCDGRKLSEIKAQAAAFKTRTDNLFAAARGNANLTTDELLESLPELTKDIAADDLVAGVEMLGLQGVDLLSAEQTRRGVAIASGKVKPSKLLTPEELLTIAFKHSNGNKSTQSSRIAALTAFMSFCKVVSPLSCTRTQAEDFLSP